MRVDLFFFKYKLPAQQGRFQELEAICAEYAEHGGMVDAMAQVRVKYGVGTALLSNPDSHTSHRLSRLSIESLESLEILESLEN